MSRIHEIVDIDGGKVIDYGPVHKGQGDGEKGADQNPGGTHQGQTVIRVELQQAHGGHHGRHSKGQQNQQVHYLI